MSDHKLPEQMRVAASGNSERPGTRDGKGKSPQEHTFRKGRNAFDLWQERARSAFNLVASEVTPAPRSGNVTSL